MGELTDDSNEEPPAGNTEPLGEEPSNGVESWFDYFGTLKMRLGGFFDLHFRGDRDREPDAATWHPSDDDAD